MIKHIDRQLFISYVKAYFVCLISMLGLYIVVDMFPNLDDFAHKSNGLEEVMTKIGLYYAYKIPAIFDRLCEVIALMAAMFTVALLQRNNELLPLLSAGVSTHRVVRSVFVSACVMLTLAVLNQELLIPRLGNRLLSSKEDPSNEKEVPVAGQYEGNGIHIHGDTATHTDMVVTQFSVFSREGVSRNVVHLTARQARYIPPGTGARSGGWLLTEAQPLDLEGLDDPEVLEQIDPGKFFLHTKEVDFDALTRPRNWYQFASTLRLFQELQKSDSNNQSNIAVLFHQRLTRPILGILLVAMGLSTILRDQNRNVFISAGFSVILCALYFIAIFFCKQLGDNNYLSPALAAWLPVLFFGPLAFVMLDMVHT